LVCATPVLHRIKRRPPCGQHWLNHNIDRCAQWILSVRKAGERELLLWPAVHHNTEELITTREAWSAVAEVLQWVETTATLGNLPPGSACVAITVNSGTWESALHADRDQLECHAHIHIQLTLPFITYVGVTVPKLARCVNDPPTYLADAARSAIQMSTDFLQAEEIAAIHVSLRSVGLAILLWLVLLTVLVLRLYF
jgi:hypothetical protein